MSKRLAKLKDEINKKYKGNYVVLAADPSAFEIQKLPTGVFALDVISYGGVPKGRISILWGEYSSGKTSAALSLVGRAQRTCRECLAFMQIAGVENSVIDEDSGEILVAHTGYDEAVNRLNAMEEYRNLSVEGKLPQKKEAEFEELTEWFNSSSLKDRKIRQVATKKYLCPKCGKADPLTAVWIDVEGVFERKWAANFHVDLESLWVARPTYAEQAVDIMNHIIRSGACDLIILDSVAAMVPTKEIEASAEKFQQGLGARIMNKAIRTWVAGISEAETSEEASTMPTIVLINQVRQKIGVMYGCFSHRTRVAMADGTTRRISELVKSQSAGPVLSFDPKTGEVQPRKIVGWHQNGKADKFLTIRTTAPNVCGYCMFDVTPDHKVYKVGDGDMVYEVGAGQLEVGDEMISSQEQRDAPWFRDLLCGCILGDGGLRMTGNVCAQLRMTHGGSQDEYLRWKVSMLQEVIGGSVGHHCVGGLRYDSNPDARLASWKQAAYGGKSKKFDPTWTMFQLCGPLALAIWYMDDGTFSGSFERWGWGKAEICAKRMSSLQREKAADWVGGLGIGRPTVTQHGLLWSGDRTKEFHEAIAKYIPECMEYKLHPKFRGGPKWESDGIPEKKTQTAKVTVEAIEERTQLGCAMQRYDLEIEENHTYMVGGSGGIAVHNSPDTMPGGKGQEFGNSLTIKLHGSKYAFEEDTGETQSRVIKATVTKSKVCPPREIAEYVLWLRSKDSHAAGSTEEPKVVMQQAMKEGVITKEKTTYFMAGKKYKTQKEMMACLVKDDMLLEEVRSATLEAMSARKLRSAT
jgi:recombination protein RecA